MAYLRVRVSGDVRQVYTRNNILRVFDETTPLDSLLSYGFMYPMTAYYHHHVRDGEVISEDSRMSVVAINAISDNVPHTTYDVCGVDWLTLSRAYVALWGSSGDDVYHHPYGWNLAKVIKTPGIHSVLHPRHNFALAIELTKADAGIEHHCDGSSSFGRLVSRFNGLIVARTEEAALTLAMADLGGPVVELEQYR